MSARHHRIMLVRHPQTVANAELRYIGRSDSPVTSVGEQQAAWVAGVVRTWGSGTVFSSPLGRALELARTLTPHGSEVQVLADLAEIDFGEAEGYTHEELAARGITFDYLTGGPIAPAGESGLDFDERVMRAANLLEEAGERVVVVSHGGVLRRLLTHLLHLPVEAAWRFAFPNAAAAVVRRSDGFAVLESLTPPPVFSKDVPPLG